MDKKKHIVIVKSITFSLRSQSKINIKNYKINLDLKKGMYAYMNIHYTVIICY